MMCRVNVVHKGRAYGGHAAMAFGVTKGVPLFLELRVDFVSKKIKELKHGTSVHRVYIYLIKGGEEVDQVHRLDVAHGFRI